jgi:hypothetical protein
MVSVRLLGLPVRLHLRSSEHAQSLEREFVLIGEQVRRDGPGSVPPRLLEVVAYLRSRHITFGAQQEAALDAAVEAGHAQVDLDVPVPARAGRGAALLVEILAEADRFCREGRYLLTPVMPPDLLAYRHWYLQQFIDQTAGGPARPWTGPLK